MSDPVLSQQKVQVPFVALGDRFRRHESALLASITEVGRSGQWVQGNIVQQFEAQFAQLCDSQYAVTVNSGFDALFLALTVLGVGHGDTVITAPNSFVATVGAIVATGAKPIFVDVADDFNLDVELLEAAITPTTKAIIPIHLTGLPARMDRINAIADAHQLYVIEDAAQAVGAKWQGQAVGGLADLGCFSLHPLKNLHVFGDGGVITTNHYEWQQHLLQLRNHGLVDRDHCQYWGYNSRLDTLQAAMATVCLSEHDQWQQRVQAIAKMYRQGLRQPVLHPIVGSQAHSVFHNYVLRVPNRNALMSWLKQSGIETKIHYPVPLHLQPAAEHWGYQRGDFPKTEAFANSMLSLPIYPELDDQQVGWVIECINQFYHH